MNTSHQPVTPAADGAAPYSGGPAGQGEYVVAPGECLEGIAAAQGFYWETLWLHPDNLALREARQDPWILRGGDRLTIPERRRRDECAPTQARTRFRRKGTAPVLRLRLRNSGIARAGEPYRLSIDGDLKEGQLDGDGALTVRVPANAHSGVLQLGDSPLSPRYDLHLSWLDPVTELSGVQARLANLGYDCPVTDEMDDATTAALGAFQHHEEVPYSARPDKETRDALVRVYGC